MPNASTAYSEGAGNVLEELTATPPEHWQTEQVIVLDWYDGPRAGLCRLRSPVAEFQFELRAERATEDDLDDRLFSIAMLRAGAFAEVLDASKFLGTPARPIWVPRWESCDKEALERADQAVEHAKQQAIATPFVVRTRDFVSFSGLWKVAKADDVVDWFSHLGLK